MSMGFLRQNSVQRLIDAAPLGEQLGEYFRATIGKAVKPLVALGFLAPFAEQETLSFEPPQQGIEGALVHVQTVLRERFAERVAILLGPQRGQDRDHEAAAAQFEANVVKQRWIHDLIPYEA
jgi:hypothetical protein